MNSSKEGVGEGVGNKESKDRAVELLRRRKADLENNSAALELDAGWEDIAALDVKDPVVLEELKTAIQEHPDVVLYNKIRRVLMNRER